MLKLVHSRPAASGSDAKQERRRHSRMNDSVSIIVRGSAGPGKTYQFNTRTRDIGAGGLSAFAPRIMETGEKITLFVRFALSEGNLAQAPSIAARAIVVRVETQHDGSCIFAAYFLRHRFI